MWWFCQWGLTKPRGRILGLFRQRQHFVMFDYKKEKFNWPKRRKREREMKKEEEVERKKKEKWRRKKKKKLRNEEEGVWPDDKWSVLFMSSYCQVDFETTEHEGLDRINWQPMQLHFPKLIHQRWLLFKQLAGNVKRLREGVFHWFNPNPINQWQMNKEHSMCSHLSNQKKKERRLCQLMLEGFLERKKKEGIGKNE